MSVWWREGLLVLSDGSVFEGEVLAAPVPVPEPGPARGARTDGAGRSDPAGRR